MTREAKITYLRIHIESRRICSLKYIKNTSCLPVIAVIVTAVTWFFLAAITKVKSNMPLSQFYFSIESLRTLIRIL